MVAAPDEKWGEVPVAFVVHQPDEPITEEMLNSYLAGRIAKFKMPRAWYVGSEALPKTGTGKILKRDLRERFWKKRRIEFRASHLSCVPEVGMRLLRGTGGAPRLLPRRVRCTPQMDQ